MVLGIECATFAGRLGLFWDFAGQDSNHDVAKKMEACENTIIMKDKFHYGPDLTVKIFDICWKWISSLGLLVD